MLKCKFMNPSGLVYDKSTKRYEMAVPEYHYVYRSDDFDGYINIFKTDKYSLTSSGCRSDLKFVTSVHKEFISLDMFTVLQGMYSELFNYVDNNRILARQTVNDFLQSAPKDYLVVAKRDFLKFVKNTKYLQFIISTDYVYELFRYAGVETPMNHSIRYYLNTECNIRLPKIIEDEVNSLVWIEDVFKETDRIQELTWKNSMMSEYVILDCRVNTEQIKSLIKTDTFVFDLSIDKNNVFNTTKGSRSIIAYLGADWYGEKITESRNSNENVNDLILNYINSYLSYMYNTVCYIVKKKKIKREGDVFTIKITYKEL